MEKSNLFSETVKKWGLIYGLIGVIFVFVTSLLGFQETQSITNSILSSILTIGIAFAIYFMATKEYRNNNDGFISFGKAYSLCLVVGLIAGLIRGVGFYFYLKFIDPNYIERIIEAQMRAQEQFGGSTPDPDQMPAFMKFFQTAEFFAFSTFFAALIGAVILGLIVAAINQKKEDHSY